MAHRQEWVLRFLSSALVMTIAGAAYRIGRSVPFSDQVELFGTLVTSAATVLGVIGIWLAVVYPAVVTGLVDRNYTGRARDLDSMNRLLLPIAFAAATLVAVSVLHILGTAAKTSEWFVAHAEIWRGLSFSLLAVVTCLLGWSMVYAFQPALSKRDELSTAVKHDTKSREHRRGVQTRPKKPDQSMRA